MTIQDFSSLPVLVTGGAGFIGSHLVETLLARGAKVRVLDNFATGKRENLAGFAGKIELIEGDIREVEVCKRACAGVEYVWHEAALGSVPRSMEDPSTSLAVNVSGTANMFTAARDAGVKRVVYASSSSVYGDSTILPKREGQEGKPLSPYAMSKWMNEELASLFTRCFGMQFVGLRYFNVFGPRQDPNGQYAAVIPRFFKAALANEAPVIFGDGEQSRDFTYVGDVVAANLLAASAPKESCGRAYNVGAGRTTTVTVLAETICRICKSTAVPAYQPKRAGDVPYSLAATEQVRDALGFEAQVGLEEGLMNIFKSLGISK